MSKAIPFHIPFISGDEVEMVNKVIQSEKVGTNGFYTHACESKLEEITQSPKVLLTSSCTHALEMAALLSDITAGDEVIMPSFNFVSAANAFVLRGAKIVFVDIDPLTMNIDVDCLEAAITNKTRAVLIMHYGGVACDMERIMPIIEKHQLILIEDAAHCIGSNYNGKPLGTFGHFGAFSFHYTKNVHCGEGGALIINREKFVSRAEIIREKGTNRKQFFEGIVDKYTWVDIGSSYLMSEMSAAFLWAQLAHLDKITERRLFLWNNYKDNVEKLGLPSMPVSDSNNGHIFYIKCKNGEQRSALIANLKAQGIQAHFHYVPLHLSTAGMNFGRFSGIDKYTSIESNRLLRLPLYFGLENSAAVVSSIEKFLLIHEG